MQTSHDDISKRTGEKKGQSVLANYTRRANFARGTVKGMQLKTQDIYYQAYISFDTFSAVQTVLQVMYEDMEKHQKSVTELLLAVRKAQQLNKSTDNETY